MINPSNGYIRKLTMPKSTDLLLYDLAGDYKFCENIGRHHKSNNVRIVVDLKLGRYYQTCHDPDCQQFRWVTVKTSIGAIKAPEFKTILSVHGGTRYIIDSLPFRSQSYQLPCSATPWQFLDDMPTKPTYDVPNAPIDGATIDQSNNKVATNIVDASKKEALQEVTNNITKSTKEMYFEDDEFDEIIRKSLL